MPDLLVIEKIFVSALQRDSAVFEDVSPVRQPKGGPRVLFDQEDRHAFSIYLLNRPEYLRNHDGSKTERRLIKQYYLGPSHERPPYREHLLLPSAQGPSVLFGPLFQDLKQP